MLSVTKMTVSYSGIVAVYGVSIRVNRGEIVSILGSNGAGKTSTIRGISGLVSMRSEGIFSRGKGSITLNRTKLSVAGSFRFRKDGVFLLG